MIIHKRFRIDFHVIFSWPELVGANVDYAVETIKKDRPDLFVQKLRAVLIIF